MTTRWTLTPPGGATNGATTQNPREHAPERNTAGARNLETRVDRDALRFVAVSNRLPVVVEHGEEGWTTHPGSGGLVTALAPVLRNRGGLWIGWAGVSDEVDLHPLLDQASREAGYRLHPVRLTPEEVRLFYRGISNEALWPLFHDLFTRAKFAPEGWRAYLEVNRKFARVVARRGRSADYIWVHDYHLMTLGRELRALGVEQRIGFFLHIPFPALDIFLKLPWRAQILHALLDYDLVGFQTARDRRNFLDCARMVVPNVRARGQGAVVSLSYAGRDVRVGAFPISIDYDEFARQAAGPSVSARTLRLREELGGRTIILGVDRLDYTKGIPERLEAFRLALSRYPELRCNVTYVQVAVPSRQTVPEYQALRAEVDRLVGEINGQFTQIGWVPIHYFFRSFDREELLAYYRAADIALVTPLKDGMNLVAKEYCAAHVDNMGTLILSEFAGAAAQLHRWALTVNPFDVEGMAEAIHSAYHMAPAERQRRMKRLRESIRRNNIFRWVDDVLEASVAKRLVDFPYEPDYIPPLEVGNDF
ncbi:MAG: trehalose-6-phosphate synthase [Thermoleophilia bacterium]|nr:trehalose-6-phosphate synthase [Thermoleophilia bacterium]